MAKGPDAFRTISEAAEELKVAQHVLRFWETRFSFIRPMKRAGGRRFYRPQDIAVLEAVRRLLHDEGLTIKEVQKLHREQGVRRLLDPSPVSSTSGLKSVPPVIAKSVQTYLRMSELVGARLDGETRARLNAAYQDLAAVKTRLDLLLS